MMKTDRRAFIRAIALGLMTAYCARRSGPPGSPANSSNGSGGDHPGQPGTGDENASSSFVTPKLMQTQLSQSNDGQWVRSFTGDAYPQDLTFTSQQLGKSVRIHSLFPNRNDPFGIDTTLKLGAGGYALSIIDHAASGTMPNGNEAPWALNMVPFGVAIDGVIMDPSGPWYDGGAPDPKNPFDRKCTGWEYDPIYKTVAELVGVPPEVRGHVQPGAGGQPGSNGLFHYHGYPYLMIHNLKRANESAAKAQQPLLVGYSADGYPIYDQEIPAAATSSGKTIHFFSGYVLRSGSRTALPHTNPALVPEGKYDGSFVQDWTYDPEAKRSFIENELKSNGHYQGLQRDAWESGAAIFQVLDEKNGTTSEGISISEYQGTIYFYVLTKDWPEIPRWFSRQPSTSFAAMNPLEPSGRRQGRRRLYDACSTDLTDVHQWEGRARY